MEDIPLLVNHFVAKFNKKTGKEITSVGKETLTAFENYHWLGNGRELESVIERAIIISQGSALQVLDRFEFFRKTGGSKRWTSKPLQNWSGITSSMFFKKTGWRIEGKDGAAIVLDINPSTLRARMRKFGIQRHQKKKPELSNQPEAVIFDITTKCDGFC